jgi:hypothetical protein
MSRGLNKIAALNWRWRLQFGHRGFQIGFGCIGWSLPTPVSELGRAGNHQTMRPVSEAAV